MNRDDIINGIISVEGGYVNDPKDSGGETNYGITVAVARANGYTGSMRDLPRQTAFAIYKAKYWDAVNADKMPIELASEVVDTAVNMGIGSAGKLLQRALNALNNQGKIFPDIAVDGGIGNGTITALNKYLKARDITVLLKALNCLQGALYIELCEKNEKNESFLYGWIKNRVEL